MTNFQNTLWQSTQWEEFQKSCGHKTVRIQGILLIERKTAFGKVFLEWPRANVVPLNKNFWQQLEQEVWRRKAVFTRVFPADGPGSTFHPPSNACIENIPETFPENTLILDLAKSQEEMLQSMKQKGRYNIKLAQEKDVEVFKSDDVDAFYKVLQETTQRDGFSGHSAVVYKKMLESFGKDGLLLLARHERQIIAGGIFLSCAGVMTYYYGASANAHRNVMAPYLVQWQAIQEAQKCGCQWYDFLGIAPAGATPQHRLFGVTQFKEKFGGTRQSYAPAFEIPHRRAWYKTLKLAARFRALY